MLPHTLLDPRAAGLDRFRAARVGAATSWSAMCGGGVVWEGARFDSSRSAANGSGIESVLI